MRGFLEDCQFTEWIDKLRHSRNEVIVLAGRRLGARPNVGNHSVALGDGSVLYRRLGYGKHPAHLIAQSRGGRPGGGIVSVRRLVESPQVVSRGAGGLRVVSNTVLWRCS